MFDIGFSEMAVIGVVALIVIGPEKLPKVARTVGILLGRAQRYVGDIKADIGRQIQLDELKRLQEQMATQARELESSVKQEVHSIESSLNDTLQALTQSVQSAQALPPAQMAQPLEAIPAPATPVVEEVALYTGEPVPKAGPPTPFVPAVTAEAGAEKMKT